MYKGLFIKFIDSNISFLQRCESVCLLFITVSLCHSLYLYVSLCVLVSVTVSVFLCTCCHEISSSLNIHENFEMNVVTGHGSQQLPRLVGQ